MPLIWVLSVEGLDIAVSWLGKKRNWKIEEAIKVFQIGIITLAIWISGYLVIQKSSTWKTVSETYIAIETELESIGAEEAMSCWSIIPLPISQRQGVQQS